MRTLNSAYVMRQEDRTGSLTVGKDADFIIIDTDIFQMERTQNWRRLRNTKVLNTVLEGEQIFKRRGNNF